MGIGDENRPQNKTQGLRYNEGKPRVDLIPAIVLLELGKHYTYGANKYHPNNWLKGFPYSETTASLLRHLYAWMAGERNDAESGHHHLVAVIWNAVALFYFELFPQKYASFDDRPVKLPVKLKVDVGAEYDPEPMRQVQSAIRDLGDIIPPTVPIPEGYAMVTDGMTLMDGDLWMSRNNVHGDKWVKLVDRDIGKKYDSTMFGSPVIRKYPKDPYRSTQIKIPAVCPNCGKAGCNCTLIDIT